MRLGFLRFFFHPRFFLKAQEKKKKKKKRLPKGPRHGGEQHLTAGGEGEVRTMPRSVSAQTHESAVGQKLEHLACIPFRLASLHNNETNETTPPRAMVSGCVRCAPISLSLSFSAVVYSKAQCFARFRFVNRSLSRTYDTAEGKEYFFLEVLLDEFSN